MRILGLSTAVVHASTKWLASKCSWLGMTPTGVTESVPSWVVITAPRPGPQGDGMARALAPGLQIFAPKSRNGAAA